MSFQNDEELARHIETLIGDDDSNGVLIMNGHAPAAIMLVWDDHAATHRIVYSKELVITGLMEHGMTRVEAIEYYEYNVVRSLDYLQDPGRPLILSVIGDLLNAKPKTPKSATKARKSKQIRQ